MILAPSILAADLPARRRGARGRARRGISVHVDVMDGRFVPNISLGPVVVEAVRRSCSLPIDCHLMVEGADRYVAAFVEAGAASVTVHVEAVTHVQRAVSRIRGRGVRRGVALNPSTPVSSLEEVLPEVDYVLVMSVNPGFSVQKFLPSTLDKVRRLRRVIDERGLRVKIQVDGGVHRGNIPRWSTRASTSWSQVGRVGDGDPEAATRTALVEAVGA